ncbi:MAG: LuxR C-terminal-related transcriptional regulator [Rhodoferax sp.]
MQRSLRRRLFEGPQAIRWRPGRELVAHLLLYLDDAPACWRIATEWVREQLDADRVDGGFGGFVSAQGAVQDYVVAAEVQRASLPLPSVQGLRFNAASPCLRKVWSAPALSVLPQVGQDQGFTEDERVTLLALGTAAKLALPLRDGANPVGLVCADWHRELPRWRDEPCQQVAELAAHALGPVLAAAAICQRGVRGPASTARTRWAPRQALLCSPPGPSAPPAGTLACLTPAELKVAQLVVNGLSYKEVARQLERSLSTVDHQLRSIREKLGVRSTARLVHVLTEHLPPAPQP